ncbi:hypothetical protein HZB69_00215 [Candidatus Amesbacteria bacterium]|nr:hypothetical protein [Candidatus Amesbacteria bacterium]
MKVTIPEVTNLLNLGGTITINRGFRKDYNRQYSEINNTIHLRNLADSLGVLVRIAFLADRDRSGPTISISHNRNGVIVRYQIKINGRIARLPNATLDSKYEFEHSPKIKIEGALRNEWIVNHRDGTQWIHILNTDNVWQEAMPISDYLKQGIIQQAVPYVSNQITFTVKDDVITGFRSENRAKPVDTAKLIVKPGQATTYDADGYWMTYDPATGRHALRTNTDKEREIIAIVMNGYSTQQDGDIVWYIKDSERIPYIRRGELLIYHPFVIDGYANKLLGQYWKEALKNRQYVDTGVYITTAGGFAFLVQDGQARFLTLSEAEKLPNNTVGVDENNKQIIVMTSPPTQMVITIDNETYIAKAEKRFNNLITLNRYQTSEIETNQPILWHNQPLIRNGIGYYFEGSDKRWYALINGNYAIPESLYNSLPSHSDSPLNSQYSYTGSDQEIYVFEILEIDGQRWIRYVSQSPTAQKVWNTLPANNEVSLNEYIQDLVRLQIRNGIGFLVTFTTTIGKNTPEFITASRLTELSIPFEVSGEDLVFRLGKHQITVHPDHTASAINLNANTDALERLINNSKLSKEQKDYYLKTKSATIPRLIIIRARKRYSISEKITINGKMS